MPLKIIRNDITKLEVDAIVNPTDQFFSGLGGIDLQVHKKAGVELEKELDCKPKLKISEAILTDGYNLKSKKIIHVAGPIWNDGNHNEEELLKKSYENCLEIIKENKFTSVAFPLISTGTFCVPKEIGLEIATNSFTTFLLEEEVDIYLVVYDKESLSISQKVFGEIQDYIKNVYEVNENFFSRSCASCVSNSNDNDYEPICYDQYEKLEVEDKISEKPFDLDIDDIPLEETFSMKLLSIIDKKELKDPYVYKKAQVDRRVFSTLRKDDNYKPTKKTAISLCLALELSYEETQDLLSRAGLTLSRSNRFDIVIEWCIKNKKYNIIEVNIILFNHDLELLS